MNIRRADAETYARWFRCLADPSRIIILNLLATARRPMTVGEIVAKLDIRQSTVSHHLGILAETRFVLVERRGTSSYFIVNERCVTRFPSAAQLIMGEVPAGEPSPIRHAPPWLEEVS